MPVCRTPVPPPTLETHNAARPPPQGTPRHRGPRRRRRRLSLPAAAQPKAGEPLKIGFVYVSPIGDAGWTFQHDTGRKEMEKALGAKVTTKYIESVPEGADAERVIRELAPTRPQPDLHDVVRLHEPDDQGRAGRSRRSSSSTRPATRPSKNVGIYNARFYEGRYLAGIVAGKMSKTNVAGYVAAFPIPEVVMGINAFARGMRSVNPKAEVKVIWVNSWFDPGKESEAANTLISQQADVLTHHTDSTAAVQAAEAKKVYAIGYHSDMSKYGPNAQLTAVTHHWGDYYTKVAQSAVDGKWQQDNVWGGIKDGMIKLAPFNKVVPPDVQELVKKAEAEIAAGKLSPFTGPMKDNTGKERLAAGKTITDADLSKMDYYVEGVVGQAAQVARPGSRRRDRAGLRPNWPRNDRGLFFRAVGIRHRLRDWSRLRPPLNCPVPELA